MTNPIVVVDVSVQSSAAPNLLLSQGAFISVGGTSLAAGTYALLPQQSTLGTLVTPPAAITSLTWSGGTVTATTAAPHGIPAAATVEVSIAGAAPTGYNGTFLATYTGASTFTYPVALNPGSETTPGTWQPQTAVELVAMNTTYWAQNPPNALVPPYVLELGLESATNAVASLGTFINASPQFFSRYLVPREWTGNSAFLTFVALYAAANKLTYFHTSVTSSSYTTFAGQKAVVSCCEAPGIPATEFTAAARFANELAANPNSSAPLSPLSYRYMFGVTTYPATGNAALLAALATADVDYIGSGSQGGVSYQILQGGNNMDGNPFTFWYASDWGVVNLQLDIGNALVNGSNNSANPLRFNQQGINRLKAVANNTLTRGVTFGCYSPGFTLTAVPFVTYQQQNPGLVLEGIYNGFNAGVTPIPNFLQVVFNLQVFDI